MKKIEKICNVTSFIFSEAECISLFLHFIKNASLLTLFHQGYVLEVRLTQGRKRFTLCNVPLRSHMA